MSNHSASVTLLPDEHAFITGTSLAHVWEKYVVYVMVGQPGHDEGVRIRERFGVVVHFPRGTDFESRFDNMDLRLQRLCLDKLLTTTPYHELRGNSYGYRIHRSYGIDQREALLEKLFKKPESKGLIINLVHPPGAPLETEVNMPNTACLAHLHVLSRDGCLNLMVNYRSQDAWIAQANYHALRRWFQMLVDDYKQRGGHAELGAMTVFIDAAHLYEHDFEQATAMASRSARGQLRLMEPAQ